MRKILILFFVLLFFNLVFNLIEVRCSSEDINVGVQVVNNGNESNSGEYSGNAGGSSSEEVFNAGKSLITSKEVLESKRNIFSESKGILKYVLMSLESKDNNLIIFVFILGIIFIVVMILIFVINHYKKFKKRS